MSMIDDFFKKYPEPIDATPVPKEVLKKYENKLPEPIIEMWKRHGFGGYEDGIFWTINPDEYQSYVNRWISMDDYVDYCPIIRTAFGDLIVICNFDNDDNEFKNIIIKMIDVRNGKLIRITSGISEFLERYFLKPGCFFGKANINDTLFNYGWIDLGLLNKDQCYGFEPILALGGEEIEENMRIFNFDAHLEMLTQALSAPLEG